MTNLEAFNRDVQNDQEYITVNDYATITSIFRTEGAPVSFVNKTFSYARQVTLTDIYFILDVLMYDQTSMSQAINSLTRDDEIAFLAASPQTVYNPVHIIDSELDDDKIAGDID
ncbi:MAG: hypothetical protein DRP42_00005 [Tenericutes bacterium]|nr:MAG: hypothetical protein DRP42_00005 [Mycoplasmatota bacterium]